MKYCIKKFNHKVMKKPQLGDTVIYFPATSDREATENGATENAAIVSQLFENNEVNVRVFSHSTNGGNVPLRQFVKHKDDVDGVRPYWVHQDELGDDEINLTNVSISSNEEGLGPTADSGSVNEGSPGAIRPMHPDEQASSTIGNQEYISSTDNALPNDTEKTLANSEANLVPAVGSDPNTSPGEGSIGSQLDSQNNAENQHNSQGSETGDLQQ